LHIQKTKLTLQHKVLLKMAQQNPNETLAEIKSMMENSTRFLSLSGFSGVLIGSYALLQWRCLFLNTKLILLK
jgi:hypothetical protein